MLLSDNEIIIHYNYKLSLLFFDKIDKLQKMIYYY